MLNSISKEDSRYIANITGNRCHNDSWRQMSLYGITEIFGENSDLIDFESSEEEEEFYLQRSMQYNDPRWTQKSNQIRLTRKKCERCNSRDDLQVHHLRYFPNRKIWEYGDEHLQILCRSCHAKEHHMFDPRGNHEDKIA